MKNTRNGAALEASSGALLTSNLLRSRGAVGRQAGGDSLDQKALLVFFRVSLRDLRFKQEGKWHHWETGVHLKLQCMCGGEFFKHSLPIHQKACAAKQQHILLECQFCGSEVPKLSLEQHLSRCPKAPKQKAAAGTAAGVAGDCNAAGGRGGVFDSSGRLQCAICGRWFTADRVARHQSICQRVFEKKRPVFDSFKQRKFDAQIHRAAEPAAAASAAKVRRPFGVAAARSYYCFERQADSRAADSRSGGGAAARGRGRGGAAAAARRRGVRLPLPAGRRGSNAASPSGSQAASSSPSARQRTQPQNPLPGQLDSHLAVPSQAGVRAGSRGRGPQGPFSRESLREMRDTLPRGPPGLRRGPPRIGPGSPATSRSRDSGRITVAGAAGGGEISTSNVCSPDNPLAYPSY
ncbi:hypothetical protein Efla_000621 [Eimeria flavescens]